MTSTELSKNENLEIKDALSHLDRNKVVANLVSILLRLNSGGLPDEVQLFASGSIDQADEDTLLKILFSLGTKQAQKLYSHYLIPSDDIIALRAAYYNDAARRESSDFESYEDDDDIAFEDPLEITQKIEKSMTESKVGALYYEIFNQDPRFDEMYASIPYCLSEKITEEVAKSIRKEPGSYKTNLMRVGPFLRQVIEAYGAYLVERTTKQNQTKVDKLLKKLPL